MIDLLRSHLDQLSGGDYFAILAYVEMSRAHREELNAMRKLVRDAKRVATSVGFGPRYLHSTGQAYKGGPNSGVFLQITQVEADDLAIPGREASFGIVKACQARGDLQVLAERGRRVVRVHIHGDPGAGLARIRRMVEQALG